jgi:hypothetical protein
MCPVGAILSTAKFYNFLPVWDKYVQADENLTDRQNTQTVTEF